MLDTSTDQSQSTSRSAKDPQSPKSSPFSGTVSRPARLGTYAMPTVLVVMFVALLIASPDFRNTANLENVLAQAVTLCLLSTGMLFLILTAGFDLSVGAAGAAAAVVAATVSAHSGILAGILLGLAVGLGIGLFNGICVAFLNVNPFVTTLGTMTMWYGLLNVFTGGTPISNGVPASWSSWGLGSTGPIANPVFIAIAAVVLATLILKFTVFGEHVYSVGSNMAAAARAGVRVRPVLCAVYAISGLLAASAGVITVAQSGVGDPTTGGDWALTAIAATVIGGARLTGGTGGMGSVLTGTFILTILSNAFTIYNLSPFWVPVITGVIVIVAVAVSSNFGQVRGILVKERQM